MGHYHQTEALSDEMAKTIHQMAYTDKQWEEARRRQRIDEESQTDKIVMTNQACLTDKEKAVKMVNQETMTDVEGKIVDIDELADENHVQMVGARTTMVKDQEAVVEVKENKTDEKKKEPARDIFAEMFAKTHQAIKRSPKPPRRNPFVEPSAGEESDDMEHSPRPRRKNPFGDPEDEKLVGLKSSDMMAVEEQAIGKELKAVSFFGGRNGTWLACFVL